MAQQPILNRVHLFLNPIEREMIFRKFWSFWKRNDKKSIKKNDLLSSAERVLTPVSQLMIGMYVIELDRPWLETKFMFQGFEIKTQEELKQLKDSLSICLYRSD
jgi:hypothetical protein